MPKYFIDTDDGDRVLKGTEGYEFADDRSARKAAIAHLPDIAADVLPDGDVRTMTVVLRNENRKAIFKASLHLLGEWLEDTDDS